MTGAARFCSVRKNKQEEHEGTRSAPKVSLHTGTVSLPRRHGSARLHPARDNTSTPLPPPSSSSRFSLTVSRLPGRHFQKAFCAQRSWILASHVSQHLDPRKTSQPLTNSSFYLFFVTFTAKIIILYSKVRHFKILLFLINLQNDLDTVGVRLD